MRFGVGEPKSLEHRGNLRGRIDEGACGMGLGMGMGLPRERNWRNSARMLLASISANKAR